MCTVSVTVPVIDLSRASKSCRRADARLLKIFQNVRKFLLLNAKVVKIALILGFWNNLTIFFFYLTCFMASSVHVSAQNFILKIQSAQKNCF